MTNKYNRFFESVKDFVLKTNLSYLEDIKGLSEVAIDKLERKFKVTFPKALRSYYAYMGEECKIIRTDDYLNYTEPKLLRTKIGAERYNLYEGIKGKIEIYQDPRDTKPKKFISLSDKMDVDAIMFLDYIAHHSMFVFITCEQENPWLDVLYAENVGGDDIDEYKYKYSSRYYSLIGDTRDQLFNALSIKFFKHDSFSSDEEGLKIFNRININELSWFQCYVEHRKKYHNFKVGNGRDYRIMRYEFSLEMDILSEETGIVMTIDEFEWAFIEHLRGLGMDI